MKEIRRQIAAANDIDLVVAECHYKGDCPGTCPKCEAEVRELEQALERRRLAGKAVSLLGISAGLLATAPEEAMAEAAESEKEMDLRDTVAVKDGAQEGWELAGKVAPAPALVRRVVDGEGKVLEGVTVAVDGMPVVVCTTDLTGQFVAYGVPEEKGLVLSCPGKEAVRVSGRSGLSLVPVVMRVMPEGGTGEMAGDFPVLAERRVVDGNGDPLAGAAVRVKGKKAVRALTGSDGMFSLRVPKGTELEVSYVGLEPERFTVGRETGKDGWFALLVPEGTEIEVSYVGLEPERFTVGRETPEVDLVLKEEPALMGEMEVAEVVQPAPVIKRDTFFAGGIQVRKIPEGSVMVQGVVVDGEGQPLRGAEILQFGKGKEELVDRTDEAGRFGAPVVLRRKRFKVAKEGYRARVVKAVEDEEKGFLWLRVVLEREER